MSSSSSKIRAFELQSKCVLRFRQARGMDGGTSGMQDE